MHLPGNLKNRESIEQALREVQAASRGTAVPDPESLQRAGGFVGLIGDALASAGDATGPAELRVALVWPGVRALAGAELAAALSRAAGASEGQPDPVERVTEAAIRWDASPPATWFGAAQDRLSAVVAAGGDASRSRDALENLAGLATAWLARMPELSGGTLPAPI